ncbi:putative glycolipid-binding domain-containing protein [Marinivivus vitaminiproducens]|uniref:putative glycolipid-binding domain-containing protein n=1 Tax=Marinivivus vitaminiproducens TaxID=3035935 RepID=UPI00279C6575|nr:putative glycolipid-binding domain-containing protein [Geminicoccaceae bacterium SCSIO 64248]
MTRIVRWTEWSGTGLQHVHVHEGDDGVLLRGVAISGDNEPVSRAYRFVIDLDRDWHVLRAEIECVDDGRSVVLNADGRGSWSDGEGIALPTLAGAIDIDLAFSPITNTLPIRRLDLQPGEAADIVTAYIAPDLSLSADPQRYTCIERARLYRYDSRDSDFTAEIEVDGDGLVVLYPGLFRRS